VSRLSTASPCTETREGPHRLALGAQLGELGLLRLGQQVLDADEEEDLRPLHLALQGEDFVHLGQHSGLVRRPGLEEADQLLALPLEVELGVRGLGLHLLHLFLDRGALPLVEVDLLGVLHHQVGRKDRPGDGVVARAVGASGEGEAAEEEQEQGGPPIKRQPA